MGRRTLTSFTRDHPRPGPGRPKGVPNKATVEVKKWAQTVLGDAVVRSKTLDLARTGRLPPAILIELLHYAYGKPTETTDLTVRVSRMVRITPPAEDLA